MREAFAYQALLTMPPDADIREPGAAITIALCGSYDHEGPCPLAPHHTAAELVGEGVLIRTLFAVEPARRGEVEALIAGALVPWRSTGGPRPVRTDESGHALRLANS